MYDFNHPLTNFPLITSFTEMKIKTDSFCVICAMCSVSDKEGETNQLFAVLIRNPVFIFVITHNPVVSQ